MAWHCRRQLAFDQRALRKKLTIAGVLITLALTPHVGLAFNLFPLSVSPLIWAISIAGLSVAALGGVSVLALLLGAGLAVKNAGDLGTVHRRLQAAHRRAAAGVERVKKHMKPNQKAIGDLIVNSVGVILVPVPAGEFTMGSPAFEADRTDDETQHRVKITKPFYLSVHEVTQQQYEVVMGNNPSEHKDANNPVENVSWYDAIEFCQKLSKQEGVEYRLPTEAEWEYACRAGTTTTYSFGDSASQLNEYAWYLANSGSQSYQPSTTHPVGEKLPNAWGLYDMHGNVYEWCQDWYAAYGSENVVFDPTGPASGERRVLRGGAFLDLLVNVRAADRGMGRSTVRGYNSGFRLARTVKHSHLTFANLSDPSSG